MREIKFRAWHFKLNRMFSAEEMTQDQMALLPDGHFANIHGSDTNKSVIYPYTSMLPLQFTGLRDKSGKEIYEGDIVIIDGGLKWICKWSDNHARFYFDTGLHKTYDFSAQESSDFEVIGNIYENPNLLEGKDG